MEGNTERLRRLKDKANKLPLTPGVYIMKNAEGEIIYIGKAKALKNRVSGYFLQTGQSWIKVQKMVDKVEDFDYILTDSEFEALVLECSLIKLHMPKYNILLKDAKGYQYIRISSEGWRNISAVFHEVDDGAKYIGPYTTGSVSQSVDEAKKIFKLPTCGKVFPRDIGHGRPCLNLYISQCTAPCAGKINREDYEECVEAAIAYLKGSNTESLRDMRSKMEDAAENLDFEKAAVLRDRINAIEKLGEKQKVVSGKYPEQDVHTIVIGDTRACLSVLRFLDNRLVDSEHFFFDELSELPAMRASLLMSYYSVRERIPPRIITDGEVEGASDIERYLTEKRGSKVSIGVPQKGEQLLLVNMCRSNATQKLAEKYVKQGEREAEGLLELQGMLKLVALPSYIEAYDISHTSGSDTVGGMVVFKDGKPFKSAYKRFAVKSYTGGDDCMAMAEVLDRRLAEYIKAGNTGEGFGKLPDLILLDGGRTQLNAVMPLLRRYSLEIPVFGMVKDARHRTAAIASSGGRVEFSVKRKAFTLVTSIQDEVHRYAIAYHKSKHGKSALSLELQQIEGIGATRAKELLKHFKTLEAIAKADANEIAAVKSMNLTTAEKVFNYFEKMRSQ